MNGLTYNIIITLITFYVLLADDLRQIFFPPSADLPFTIINVILMSFYIIDICVSCYARVPIHLLRTVTFSASSSGST